MTDPDAEGGEDEIIATDFSLGGEHRESSYSEFVEPEQISADDYFALTDDEKRKVPRDDRSLPIGYWFWSQEARNRYGRENPRQEQVKSKNQADGNGDGAASISAKPYVWRDPKSIPPRQFLHAGHYVRGFLSATIGSGGLGKTSLQLVETVGMVAGHDLLKGTTSPRKLRVWYWNLEDPQDEIDRRIAAILLHYNIGPSEVEGRLFVNSETPLVIATKVKDVAVVAEPAVNGLVSEIKRLSIDALIVDPFVSSHKVPENDNGAIDAVAKTWSRIGRECDCAVELAHHIRKPSSGSTADITVDDARGAGALKDAGRSVRVLNVMSKEEAESVSVKPDQRRRYFRVEDGKANMKPPAENIEWRKLVSVPLGNGTEEMPGERLI
jgi:RecA-family ATPase